MLSGNSRHCWPRYFELLNKTQLREYEISVEANSKTKIRGRRRKNKQVPAAVWAQTKESVTNMTDHSAVTVLSRTFSTEGVHSQLLSRSCRTYMDMVHVHGPIGCKMAEELLMLMVHWAWTAKHTNSWHIFSTEHGNNIRWDESWSL